MAENARRLIEVADAAALAEVAAVRLLARMAANPRPHRDLSHRRIEPEAAL